nr:hypothetical protein [Tanacetum cinerariifolium]
CAYFVTARSASGKPTQCTGRDDGKGIIPGSVDHIYGAIEACAMTGGEMEFVVEWLEVLERVNLFSLKDVQLKARRK